MIEARADDAPALAALHAAAFPETQRWGTEAIWLTLELPGVFGLHVPDAGFILARVATDEAEILTLAVAPEARRQGQGAALLGHAMAAARARGALTMFLEVSRTNEAARALYAAVGFVEVGKRAGYYADGGDALVLRRALNPA